MTRLGFEPFDVIVTVPVTLPDACGAKASVKLVLWDALSVKGVESPLS